MWNVFLFVLAFSFSFGTIYYINFCLLQKPSSAGRCQTIKNEKRRFGSNPSYIYVAVNKDGENIELLITENVVKEGRARARKNYEDLLIARKQKGR